MRVAIIGSRDCQDNVTDEIMRRIPADASLIISGGARGVDTFAELAAEKLQIPFRKILPEYEKYGSKAPIIRNRDIVRCADMVIAFWDYHSRGTASTIACCIENGVPVEIIAIRTGS